MAAALRVGVLGLTHDHVWKALRELRESPGMELAGVADPNRPLLQRAEQELGCPIYRDFAPLLDREKLDAAYVFSDNATGVMLTEEAAARKLHVMVEKPMASTLAGADRMLAAVRRAGVQLMINWPFAWSPQLQHAIELARNGRIGDLWQIKYRASHEGPRELGCSEYFCDWLYDPKLSGGGALIDYCCYGAALARTLLGMPSRVTAMSGRLCKEDILVEDNAVILMNYPRAMAISEGSWSQIGNLTSYITVIHGTLGTLLVEPNSSGRLLLATSDAPQGIEVPAPSPPLHGRSATSHFLAAIRDGQPIMPLCSARVARDAQEILEAGLAATESGQEVSLPLRI